MDFTKFDEENPKTVALIAYRVGQAVRDVAVPGAGVVNHRGIQRETAKLLGLRNQMALSTASSVGRKLLKGEKHRGTYVAGSDVARVIYYLLYVTYLPESVREKVVDILTAHGGEWAEIADLPPHQLGGIDRNAVREFVRASVHYMDYTDTEDVVEKLHQLAEDVARNFD